MLQKIIKNLIVAIPFVAILVTGSLFFPFITGKAFAWRLLVECAFCLFVLLCIKDRSYLPRPKPIVLSFVAFTLVMFIADIFAYSPVKALFSNFERMEGFVGLIHLCLYFIVLSGVFRSTDDFMDWLGSTLSVSLFMTVFSLLQFLGGLVINQGGVRLDGTLGNASYLATYLVFHIFFLVFVWIHDNAHRRMISWIAIRGLVLFVVYYLWQLSLPQVSRTVPGIILIVCAILLIIKIAVFAYHKNLARLYSFFSISLYISILGLHLFILYYTATRGAILGLIGGVLLAALFILLKEKKNIFIKKISLGFLCFLLCLVGLFFVFKDSSFVHNSSVLSRFASISWSENKTQARGYVWPIAIKAFEEHPILGWGQDNFIFAFAKYYTPEMIRHEAWFDRTHNTFLDWLVSGGILGFGFFVAIFFFALKDLFLNKKFDVSEKGILFGLFAAYIFLSLFIFDNLISSVLFVFLIAFVSSEENKKNTPIPLGADVVFALLGFIMIAFFVNFSPWNQSRLLVKALSPQQEGVQKNYELFDKAFSESLLGRHEVLEQLVDTTQTLIGIESLDLQTKNKFASLAFEKINALLSSYPYDVRIFALGGSFLANIGDYKDALPFIEKALEMSPYKQQFYYSLAQIYFTRGQTESRLEDIDLGLLTLKKASELTPSIDNPKIVYIRALLSLKKKHDALGLILTLENPGYLLDSDMMDWIVSNWQKEDVKKVLDYINNKNPEKGEEISLLRQKLAY